MIFQGAHSVIRAIKEKKRLMQAGESHEHIRPLLVQGAGLMRGSYGLGASIALEEMGYNDVFSYLVGISSGAPIVGHFAAGTSSRIAAILDDHVVRDFVNPWRLRNQVDTKSFMDIMRNDPKKSISAKKALANPTQVYFGVTEHKTALPHILRPRDEEHFYECLHASVNLPNFSSYKIIIDGVHYADGGYSRPHVLSEAIRQLQPTHVLYITNNDRDFTPISKAERLLNRTIFRLRLNGVAAQAINSRRESRDLAIESAISGGTETAVIWGDNSIAALERNKKKIVAAIEASRSWWHNLFDHDV